MPQWQLGRNALLARALFSLPPHVICSCIKPEAVITAAVSPPISAHVSSAMLPACMRGGLQWAGMGAADLGSQPRWDSDRDRDGNGNSERDRDSNVSACSSQHMWSCTRIRTDTTSSVTCGGALVPRCEDPQCVTHFGNYPTAGKLFWLT